MKNVNLENPLILEQAAPAKDRTESSYANRHRKSAVQQEETSSFISFLGAPLPF